MPLPFFYAAEIKTTASHFVLNEETSRHVVQVLRMAVGEQLKLTDGAGNLFLAKIIDNDKRKCGLQILSCTAQEIPFRKITIAISLVKSNTRFEWFLEKATEIGVYQIIPLLCTRTEKQFFKTERMRSILISAMLQSQQSWLPFLHEPTKFSTLLSTNIPKKFIAHCEEDHKEPLQNNIDSSPSESLILIGPEGDFTKEEITAALQNNFLPVALGNTRLRTETAGIFAATILSL